MADSIQGMLVTPCGSTGLLHENVIIKCTNMILTVYFETLPLSSREQHIFRAFEDWMLKRMLGLRREEMTGD